MFYKYLKLHYDIITNPDSENISKLIHLNKNFIRALKNTKHGGASITDIMEQKKVLLGLIKQLKKSVVTKETAEKIIEICSVLKDLIALLLEVDTKLDEKQIKELKHQLEDISGIISSYQ